MTVATATRGVYHPGDNLWETGPRQLMTTPRSTGTPDTLGQTVGDCG